MIRRPPRSTRVRSSAASDVYKRQKRPAAAGRVKRHGPTRQPVAPTAATRLPRRPDPSILSEAIPLFFIGRNKDGFWVARDADGSAGGIFLLKRSALQFANTNTQPRGCATMCVSERFELCLLYTSDAADDLTRVDLGG